MNPLLLKYKWRYPWNATIKKDCFPEFPSTKERREQKQIIMTKQTPHNNDMTDAQERRTATEEQYNQLF